VEAVQDAAERAENLAPYGGGLGNSMSIVARMIRGGLGSRIYTVSLGGFDTHSMQGGVQGSHAAQLRAVADAVSAFLADLAVDGLDKRVLVMTFSEFGRTLSENGSQGTDHGAGAPMLVFGSELRGGVFGSASDLTDLYGGDPRYSTDYRSVYSTVLSDWFGLASGEVESLLGGSYGSLGFIDGRAVYAGDEQVPRGIGLHQNYPNPFNPTTTISYRLDGPGHVRLRIFDVRGALVQTLVDGNRPAGAHTTAFDAQSLPSGTYVYRLETADGTLTRKMTLSR
jgi:hypothetical protein